MEKFNSCYTCKFFKPYYFKFKLRFKAVANGTCSQAAIPKKNTTKFLEQNNCAMWQEKNPEEERAAEYQSIEKALKVTISNIEEILLYIKNIDV